MEINVQKYLDAVANVDMVVAEHTTTPAAVEKDGLARALAPLFSDARTNLGADRIMQTMVTISSAEPTVVSLEAGVVNLPMADAKKITNFLENDEIVPVRLYLIVTSKFVNASGLRIDEVATADEYLAHPDQYEADIVKAVQEKLDHIADEAAKPQEEVKPTTTAKKPAAKKTTTRRKTTAKKTTTRKRATTKKAATKRTAAKSTTKKATSKSVKKVTD